MTRQPHAAADRWVIVSAEPELIAMLPAASLDPEVAGRPRGAADRCIRDCIAAALLRVRRGRPVALLVSDIGAVLRMRIPPVGRVSRFWTERTSRFCFTIAGWELRFSLEQRQTQWIAAVIDAFESREDLLVVDHLFDGEVVHLQRWGVSSRCNPEFDVRPHHVSMVTKRRANELYSSVFSSDSKPPYTDGIPFRFSPAFCHAVAHAVSEALAQEGTVAAKVWAFAKSKKQFVIRTTSRRSCRQAWVFHVAAIVRSTRTGGWWVLDPTTNLERGVVAMDEWLAGLGAVVGRVRLTRREAYRLVDDDPRAKVLCFDEHTPGESDEDLMVARCALACLAEEEGHPPHRC